MILTKIVCLKSNNVGVSDNSVNTAPKLDGGTGVNSNSANTLLKSYLSQLVTVKS